MFLLYILQVLSSYIATNTISIVISEPRLSYSQSFCYHGNYQDSWHAKLASGGGFDTALVIL